MARLTRSVEADTVTLSSRPRLADGVAVGDPDTAGSCLVTIEGVPRSRVSVDAATVLRRLDGTTPVAQVANESASPDVTAEAVLDLVRQAARAGLLAGSERRPAGRLAYLPPLTVQVASVRAAGLLSRLSSILPNPSARAIDWTLAAVLSLGGVALALQAAGIARIVTSPLTPSALLTVILVLGASTFAHEAAHGVTLLRAGGHPRRLGVMLFYLTPAFFVDVTDGWRLPQPRSRVRVALAGPAVNATIAALTALIAAAVPDPTASAVLLLISVASVGVVLVNALPFVRFDGYLAVMSALDEPRLRARTLRDAEAAMNRLLFGLARPPREVDRSWSVPFGVLSVLTPLVLIWVALERILFSAAAGGPALAAIILVTEVALVAVLVVLIRRWLRRVWSARPSPLRLAGAAVTVVLATTIVAWLPVPTARVVGFVRDGATVTLVSADTAPTPASTGASVTFAPNGILLRPQRSAGEVLSSAAGRIRVPVEAILPVTIPGTTVPAAVVATAHADDAAALPRAGRAVIAGPTLPLGIWVWNTRVLAPVQTLLSGLPHREGDNQ